MELNSIGFNRVRKLSRKHWTPLHPIEAVKMMLSWAWLTMATFRRFYYVVDRSASHYFSYPPSLSFSTAHNTINTHPHYHTSHNSKTPLAGMPLQESPPPELP